MTDNALGYWKLTGPQGRRLFAMCAGACVGGLWLMNKMIDKKETSKGNDRAVRMNRQFVHDEAVPAMQSRGLTDIDGRPVAGRHDLQTGAGNRASAHTGRL